MAIFTQTTQADRHQDVVARLRALSDNLISAYKYIPSIDSITQSPSSSNEVLPLELMRAIQATPCTLLYVYARWNGHAMAYLSGLHDPDNIPVLARLALSRRAAIETGQLCLLIVETNEAPKSLAHTITEDSGKLQFDHMIDDGKYWSSLSLISLACVRPVFIWASTGQDLWTVDSLLDSCLERSVLQVLNGLPSQCPAPQEYDGKGSTVAYDCKI